MSVPIYTAGIRRASGIRPAGKAAGWLISQSRDKQWS